MKELIVIGHTGHGISRTITDSGYLIVIDDINQLHDKPTYPITNRKIPDLPEIEMVRVFDDSRKKSYHNPKTVKTSYKRMR